MVEPPADLHPRYFGAGNSGPFTLDGTRTYLIGSERIAAIDPGPELGPHLAALTTALAGAEAVTVVVTHGHPDHAPGAQGLAAALRALGVSTEVAGPPGLAVVGRPLGDGETVRTDDGDLIAVETPGHARPHLAFHWPSRRALFAGDLLLGKGDTVWVGEYAGAVADYLRSLDRVRALELDVIYPAHGPPIADPLDALDRYAEHRRARIRQVEAALAADPGASVEALLVAVYGSALPATARRAALLSIEALKAHVEGRREDP